MQNFFLAAAGLKVVTWVIQTLVIHYANPFNWGFAILSFVFSLVFKWKRFFFGQLYGDPHNDSDSEEEIDHSSREEEQHRLGQPDEEFIRQRTSRRPRVASDYLRSNLTGMKTTKSSGKFRALLDFQSWLGPKNMQMGTYVVYFLFGLILVGYIGMLMIDYHDIYIEAVDKVSRARFVASSDICTPAGRAYSDAEQVQKCIKNDAIIRDGVHLIVLRRFFLRHFWFCGEKDCLALLSELNGTVIFVLLSLLVCGILAFYGWLGLYVRKKEIRRRQQEDVLPNYTWPPAMLSADMQRLQPPLAFPTTRLLSPSSESTTILLKQD